MALAAAIALILQRSAVAIAVAAAVIGMQWAAPPGDERGAVHFLAAQWEPDPPPGARPFMER